MNIIEKIKSKNVYFDGAMGTMLQNMGLNGGIPPEMLNLSAPEKIIAVHKAYLEAGSDIITANTFGVNSYKYDNYLELAQAAMKCAVSAVKDYPGKFIAFDIGPTGRLTEPMGDMSFEEAVSIFKDSVRAAVSFGADLIVIETMNDCLETKAAVIAAKENSDLPVFVTNAYDRSGKLMTGATPAAMVAMLEGLGADAIGMNCSFGPDLMLDLADEFIKNASVPIMANPNAGLPEVKNKETVYSVSAENFSDCMKKLCEKGVTILGGCCGTTPEYIKKTIEKTKDILFAAPTAKTQTVISSYANAAVIGKEPLLIGERINPTGKPKLKTALRENNINYILSEAIKQAEAGAHILDINVGLPEIDEPKVLKNAVTAVQSVTDLPLQLDSSDPKALEAGMRVYAGKPLVNSVTGDESSMEAVFPLVKKYGGAVIALTMDSAGIPVTALGRFEIAERILKRAESFGIDKKDIIFDPLCMTISAGDKNGLVTLGTVRLLKNAGYLTSLGISNVSFGLPHREKINSAFFSAALENGLDLAIMNPFSSGMLDAYYAYRTIHGLDPSCADYIAYAEKDEGDAELKTTVSAEKTLKSAVVSGLSCESAVLAKALLSDISPTDVINLHIIPALDEIGVQFEKGKAYLPQLLMSADAAAAAFNEVKKAIPADVENERGKIILATVKGDIHDIGKNIVKVMLESYGFKVYDLGKDVDPEKVIEAVRNYSCKLVGLSALMTTTVPSMEKTIKLLKNYDESIKTVVGGAVLNREYADMIGADFYAKDAMDTVRFAEEYYK